MRSHSHLLFNNYLRRLKRKSERDKLNTMAYGPDAAFKKPTKHDLCSFNVPNQPSLKEKLENALLSLVLNLFL